MPKENLRRFGNRVRELRTERGITQEELAEASGLHPTYIGGIERGERNLGLINIVKIAEALNVPPSALFSLLDGEKS